ncbi:MAG: winged helix-turn-helix transcriptional regulator [Clostridiales bacterium]|nr:winged helix-turn-helix transcriptional regulator [Clostridiales bacterium]
MEQRYETFTLLVLNLSRCVQKIKNKEVESLGLKGTHVQCLFTLFNSDKGASLTELCSICGEDKGMMSRTLKELTAKGLVYIDEQENKKYRNPYKLTELGTESAKIVSEKVSRILDLVAVGVTEEDRVKMYDTLSHICNTLTEFCKSYKD